MHKLRMMNYFHSFIPKLCRRSLCKNIAVVLFFCFQGISTVTASTPVTLQLHWNHQFQFAGYYAALEQGYYAEAGLDVTIKDGGYSTTGEAVRPEEEVLFGRAQFGTTRTDLLINHSEGLPVIVLANIMQHSPLVFLTLEKYGFNQLEQIGYTRPITLNINQNSSNRIDAEAVAALKIAGVELNSLNNSFPSWQLQDLLDGTTRLMPAYSTDEPYFVRKAGATPVFIEPRNYGVDFYGDLLFTSQNMLQNYPEIVRDFRATSLRGWKYAMNHPAQVVDLILARYKTRNSAYDKEFLLYEAEKIKELMSPDIIQIGYSNVERWKNIADIYQSLGLVKSYNLDSFLYQPDKPNFWSTYQKWILFSFALFVLGFVILFYFYFLNTALRKEISKRNDVERELKVLAQLDFLTGSDNRCVFERSLEREFERAHRHDQPLTLLMIDIDDFKRINDSFGHLAGDEVLKSFVTVSKNLLRKSDLFARYGGEEFVILMPVTRLNDAVLLAHRLLNHVREDRVNFEGKSINYTISIGLAEINDSDENPHELLKRSDMMLYKAKQSGKDCLMH